MLSDNHKLELTNYLKQSSLTIPELAQTVSPLMQQELNLSNELDVAYYAYCILTDKSYDSIPIEDLTDLSFSLKRSSHTGGLLMKAFKDNTYYKMSFMSGLQVVGTESIMEYIANTVCKLFNFNYLPYTLHYARTNISGHSIDSWLVSSPNYLSQGEYRTPLETYLVTNGCKDIFNPEEVLNSILRLPTDLQQQIFNMCVIDFIIYNRDRHGANIELISNGHVRLAPIFDCGSSLIAPLQDNDNYIMNFNPLIDNPVNNFIGSQFLSECIAMFPSSFQVPTVKWSKDLLDLPEGALPDKYLNKINEIISKRLEWLYEIRNSVCRK